jgi:hypothetical protein
VVAQSRKAKNIAVLSVRMRDQRRISSAIVGIGAARKKYSRRLTAGCQGHGLHSQPLILSRERSTFSRDPLWEWLFFSHEWPHPSGFLCRQNVLSLFAGFRVRLSPSVGCIASKSANTFSSG